MPRLTRSKLRQARAESRRDAATLEIPETSETPTPYQSRLQNECDYAIRVDLEERYSLGTKYADDEMRVRDVEFELSSRIVSRRKILVETREQLDELPRPQWPGRLSGGPKWLLFILLGAFEFILIRTALDLLVLDDSIKNVTAGLIGFVPIITIELNGAQILELFKYHREDIPRRRAWLFASILLSIVGLTIIAFIVFMGIVRADGFSTSTGFATVAVFAKVPTSYATSLAAGLAILQALATTAALALTRQQAEGDQWRHVHDAQSEHERILEDLEDELADLKEEHGELSSRASGLGSVARQHHLALTDYFGVLEAAYRAVFCRARPETEARLSAVWAEWRDHLLETLQADYGVLDSWVQGAAQFADVSRPPGSPDEKSHMTDSSIGPDDGPPPQS